MNDPTSLSGARDYGLSRALRIRLMGAFLGVIGGALLVTTVGVAVLDLPAGVLSGLAVST